MIKLLKSFNLVVKSFFGNFHRHLAIFYWSHWAPDLSWHSFFKWANPGLFFFIFVVSTVNSTYIQYKILPMTGFEPQISGTGSNRSANCATTTAQISFSPSNVKYSERFLCKRRRRNQFYRFIGKIRK